MLSRPPPIRLESVGKRYRLGEREEGGMVFHP